MRRTTRGWLLLGLFAAAAAAQPACMGSGLNQAPAVFPSAARLGDTIAMSIASNAMALGNVTERYDLSEDNVTVRVRDPDAGFAEVQVLTPHAVMNAGPTDAAQFTFGAAGAQLTSGAELTIVLLNLPDPLAQTFTFPKTLQLQLLVDGLEVSGVTGTVTVTGDGGAPTNFSPSTDPLNMQPKPMVRLQGNYDASGQVGFPGTSTPIGGIEFTLVYPKLVLASPELYPVSDASRATAIAGPEIDVGTDDRSVRVVVADPKGFALPDDAYGHVGEGPILDIVFQKLAPFDEQNIQIQDLMVTDVDGATVVSKSGDARAYFTILPVKNL